jgi:major type 1 subunit fimbrin (pilin)
MKLILIASLATAMLSPVIAVAADGTINFTGSVVASTCTYDGTSGKSQLVTLPSVSASALSTAGNTAGDTAFDVRLSNCGTASKNVAINLEGVAFDAATGHLNNTAGTGGAAKVSVQLANRNSGSVIRVPSASATVLSTTDGNAIIPLLARYVANGEVTAGTVTSSVNFSIIYP